jgi:hypothetical protein
MGDVQITKDTLTPGIAKLDDDILDIVFKVFTYWSTKGVSEMRTNAKWSDRTGNARNGLGATVYDTDKYIDLVFYHRVPYGVFLEVRWSGKYAIIGPTMASVAPRLAAMVSQAILDNGGRSNA